ncbi:MAG: hypothetical protein IPJ36_09565 [Simplicispira sp.]|nr:hypothetical protein [Simplicispira sp.]
MSSIIAGSTARVGNVASIQGNLVEFFAQGRFTRAFLVTKGDLEACWAGV